jgi:hypothetical protein
MQHHKHSSAAAHHIHTRTPKVGPCSTHAPFTAAGYASIAVTSRAALHSGWLPEAWLGGAVTKQPACWVRIVPETVS